MLRLCLIYQKFEKKNIREKNRNKKNEKNI